MDIKKLKSIADIFTSAGLTELEIAEGELKIVMKRNCSVTTSEFMQPAVMASESAKTASVATEVPGRFIKAPFAGVFYTKPSPDSEPFITAGKAVKKGDTVCILEAMKLMNELKAEEDCVVLEICAQNGDIVEYGQPLFRIG